MNNTLKATMAVAAAALIVTPAFAQVKKPTGLSVRAGLFLAQGRAEDLEGQNWFTAGVEYKLGDLSYQDNMTASYSLSLDYYGKGSLSSAPLLMNYIGRFEGFYYSAGAGVAFTHQNFSGGGNSSSDMEFAYKLTLGKDFVRSNTPFFVELSYHGNNRTDLNGFAVVGGLRF